MEELRKMDPALQFVLLLLVALFGLIAFFAQMRLFIIANLLKDIKNELLIFRQERQTPPGN